MEEYTGAVRRSIDGGIYWSSEEVNRWRNILEQMEEVIDGGIYWSMRRSIDGGIYWSSEEVNRWREQ